MMKGPAALLLCIMITAVAFSAPLPSEEEMAIGMHPFRDKLLSPHRNANRLGILSSLPRSSSISHPSDPFLSSRKRTSEDSEDVLLQMMQGLASMKRAKSQSSRLDELEARLQLAEVLQEIVNFMPPNELTPRESSVPIKDKHSIKVTSSASDSENGLHDGKELEEHVVQLIRDLAEKCVVPFTHQVANSIKFLDNFGSHNSLLQKLSKFTSSFLNTLISSITGNPDSRSFTEILSNFISLFTGLSDTGSENFVRGEQIIGSDRVFLRNLFRRLVERLGYTLPNAIEHDGTNSINSILNNLAMFFSNERLKLNHTLNFVNNSANVFLKILDSPLYSWSENFKNAIKSFVTSAVPVLYNNLHQQDSTREEKMSLLKSTVKIILTGLNLESIGIDSVFRLLFSNDKPKEETGSELQPILGSIYRSFSMVLKNITRHGIEIDEEGCSGAINEVARLAFAFLPGLLDRDGSSAGSIVNVESWETLSREEKVNTEQGSKFIVPVWDTFISEE